jgi:hypothetical protein
MRGPDPLVSDRYGAVRADRGQHATGEHGRMDTKTRKRKRGLSLGSKTKELQEQGNCFAADDGGASNMVKVSDIHRPAPPLPRSMPREAACFGLTYLSVCVCARARACVRA